MPESAKSYNFNLLSEENVKRSVLPFYNLENSQVTAIKFKNTDKQRAVYKVTYLSKQYCLKKVYFNKEELLFVYSAIEWLYRNNIRVPKILPTKYNGRFVNYKNMLFILTPWIDGDKCDYDCHDHLIKSSYNLGYMHNICLNFTPIIGSFNRKGCNDFYKSINKHFENLLSNSNLAFKYKDYFSKTFLNDFGKGIYLAQKSLEALSKINPDNLTVSLCHMDYVNKNIIFDNSSNIWLIDFDKCRMDYAVHDFSYFFRRLLKRDNTDWNMDILLNCLESYEKIRPLTIDEYNYLLGYLAFPQRYWKISRDYYRNIRQCNKKSFTNILKKSTKHFDSQIKFAESFSCYIENKFNTTKKSPIY
ncbi:CotS family spore coat protein [Clostridium aestuarii]|uniref:CotS family spore coat protein n=1 Tax=Clostridium aestuarii TaxID=338193 RepID=A0ABT4D250_9CLOT|nr:CotS family spore coat protein [Clostridium aestuarii]MCY6484240.1 CotS family spore coat protein [Clostridium aestuarii]